LFCLARRTEINMTVQTAHLCWFLALRRGGQEIGRLALRSLYVSALLPSPLVVARSAGW